MRGRDWDVQLVLLIILAVVLALLIVWRSGAVGSLAPVALIVMPPSRGATGEVKDTDEIARTATGGAESEQSAGGSRSAEVRDHPPPTEVDDHPHELMRAVFDDKLETMRGDHGGAIRPPTLGGGALGGGALGGGDKRKWTDFATWKELAGTPQFRQYWMERQHALKNYPASWARVRKQLAAEVQDSHEWAGCINLTSVKPSDKSGFTELVPEVVEKLPGPQGAGAMISVEVMRKISRRPAMFLFHTHPSNTSPFVSSLDVATAIMGCFLGHHAAHLVVSEQAIIMYGLLPATLARLWDDGHPQLAAARKSFDAYNAIEALRSYGDYYSAKDIEGVMRNLGLLYVIFPLDSFAQTYYSEVFVPSTRVNLGELRTQLQMLEHAQREAYSDEGGPLFGEKKDEPRAHREDLPVATERD